MLRVRSALRKLAASPHQGSEPASLEEVWAEAWETLPPPWSSPSPESYRPTIERMLRSTDDEIIAFLRASLQPIGRHSASRFLAFLDNSYGATDRWTAWVVGLSPDIARWLGSDFGHDRAQTVLERVPAEQLYPLAQAFVAETLGEPDPECHDVGTYWGLLEFLQTVGFRDLATLVAQAAADCGSGYDEDLPPAGRRWLQELENGIGRQA